MAKASSQVAVGTSDATASALRDKSLREVPGGGFFALDAGLRFILADGAILSELGYERSEIQGRLLDEVTSAPTAMVLKRLYSRAVEGQTCETELAASRTEKTVWVQASPARDAAGAVMGVLVIVLDVTERRRAQAALAVSEGRHRSVVEALEEGILAAAADGSVISCNRAAQRILGMSGAEILGRTATDSRWQIRYEDGTPCPPERLPLNVALCTGEAQPTVVLNVQRPDGQTRWVSVTAVPLPGPTAGFGAACSFVDVTPMRTALEKLRARDAMVTSSMRDSPIGIALQTLDGRYTAVNPALCRLLGRSEDELLQLGFQDVTPAEDCESETRLRRLLADGERDNFQLTKRYMRPGGDAVSALVSVTLMRDGGGHAQQYVLQAVDLTERVRFERELRQRAEQQSVVARLGERALQGVELSALGNAGVTAVARTLGVELVSLLELDHDEQTFRLAAGFGWPSRRVRGSAGRLTGEHERLLLRLEDGPLIVGDRAGCGALDDLLAEHGVTSSAIVAVGGRDRPPGVLAAHARCGQRFTRGDADFLQAVANVLSSALQRRDAEERMRHQAMHDWLTGLPNRLLCLDRLAQALARTRRTVRRVALLLIDLDNFKVVNDSLGHHAGDALLRALAPRLAQAVRAGDSVARLGGDEFVVICEDISDERDAHDLATRITDTLARPFVLDGSEHLVQASIGVVVADASATPESLLRDADAAMYRAKDRGRGRHEFFDETLRARAVARHTIESDLRRALSAGQLCVYYQPYVALADRRLIGMEALVRWEHPDLGLVAPDQFIPVAEDSGLIVELGEFVLRESCRQLAAWRSSFGEMAELGMSVNVSGRQLMRPGLADTVAVALRDSGLRHAASLLSLEITESVLMNDGHAPQGSLGELKALGVGLVLDDFGTGYSSLSRLKDLPIDVVKIDRAFVDGLDAAHSDDEAIVASILGMARAMRLSVIAEGVETEAQAQRLQTLGCLLAQGYLFSRPLPANAMSQLLAGELP